MPENQQTRLTLIQRVCSGERDDHCWEDFVETYSNYISVIIKNFKLGDAIHEDLLQDVLLSLWKSLPKFQYEPQKCRFRTWLSVVCKNSVKTYLKSKAGRIQSKEVNYEEAYQSMDSVTNAEVEAIAEREWKLFIAEKAMKNISEKLSEKLISIFSASIDGISDSELAKNYETMESNIRVYRHRVKNALMKEIIRLNKVLDS